MIVSQLITADRRALHGTCAVQRLTFHGNIVMVLVKLLLADVTFQDNVRLHVVSVVIDVRAMLAFWNVYNIYRYYSN